MPLARTHRLLWTVLCAAPAAALARAPIVFTPVAETSGVRFEHSHGGCGRRSFAEQVGGGVAFLDFDGNGRLDVYFMSGTSLFGCPAQSTPCRLFRNRGNGRFEEVSRGAGLASPGYATGCALGDHDNDGDEDIYITCHGANKLYRNDGGRFIDVTAEAGVGDPSLSTSCAFLDHDLDGDLDLYVANYVVLPEDEPDCRRQGIPAYCLPQDFRAAPDRFFENLGDGRFVDATRRAGLLRRRGRGLGVTVGDYNNDGAPDIYVANDANDNFLFRNNGDGTFTECGLTSGVALSADGVMENGMGTDWADFDGDGQLDLVVTNFEGQTNTLYRNLGDGFFADVSYTSGTGAASYPLLGWASLFADFDRDGLQDLFVANGHVFDNVAEFREGTTFAQRNLLWRNLGGGKFALAPAAGSPGLARIGVSRGAAVADYDNDGDLDIAVNNLGGVADLLRNDTPSAHHWLGIRLRGATTNRSAIGARVTLTAGGVSRTGEVKSGSGYLSQSDLRLFFGLGTATHVETLTVRWPGGENETFPIEAVDRYLELVEGKGR